MRDYVLAIDPGTTESGVCLVRTEDCRPIAFDKIKNEDVEEWVWEKCSGLEFDLVIEMVATYGMPVGREVFETCVWIGRFIEQIDNGDKYNFIYRNEEKITLCRSPKANDATIKQALVDRFAWGQKNYGKGTKNNPGWFYGFQHDIWQAYAVAVTYIEKQRYPG